MSDIYTDLYTASYSGTTAPERVKVKSVFAMTFNGVDFVTDLVSFELKSKKLDSDRLTFGKYSRGLGVEWDLKIKAVFDGGSEESLHGWLWQNASATVPFIIRPFQEFDPLYGRFFQGQVRIPYRPDIKVKAGDTSTFDYEFKVIGHPSRSESPNGILTSRLYSEI